MKFNVYIVAFSLMIISTTILSQTTERNSLNEFSSGKTKKYSTFGLGKSQGLELHFKYPASWKSIEGEHPHVVRKFAQSDDLVLSFIRI